MYQDRLTLVELETGVLASKVRGTSHATRVIPYWTLIPCMLCL